MKDSAYASALPMADQRQQGVPDPRAAVRVAQFERSLEIFNREQGTKVALVLAKYDEEMVQPRIAELRERIEALEQSWWKRLWRKG